MTGDNLVLMLVGAAVIIGVFAIGFACGVYVVVARLAAVFKQMKELRL
jgi:hypothetical protein